MRGSWIGGGVASLSALPTWVILGGVAGLFVFLTEVTSNAATTTMKPMMIRKKSFWIASAVKRLWFSSRQSMVRYGAPPST